MPSLTYYLSLLSICLLVILLQEYRKLGRTKAVLSRVATKNGWNITFRETIFKLEADLSVPSANGEAWELKFKTDLNGTSVACRSSFSAEFRERAIARDMEFASVLFFFPEGIQQQEGQEQFNGPFPPVFDCTVTFEDQSFEILRQETIDHLERLLVSPEWARYLRLGDVCFNNFYLFLTLPTSLVDEKKLTAFLEAIEALKMMFEHRLDELWKEISLD